MAEMTRKQPFSAFKLGEVLDQPRTMKWLMSGPALAVVLALMVYPLITLILMSMRDYSGSTTEYSWAWFKWYAELPRDGRFLAAFYRTVVFSGGSVAGAMVAGTVMALIVNMNFKGVGLVRTLFTLPYMTMLVAAALMWNIVLSPSQGILNYFLQELGLPPGEWLATTKTALPTLMMIQIWRSAPFTMLIVLAALRTLPAEPFEAAEIDGASTWQRFWYLTLPMLQAALTTATLFLFIDTLKQFPLIWVLTEGGPLRASETLYVYGYNLAFRFFDLGYGAAVLTTLLVLVLVVSAFWMWVRQRAWL